LHAVVGFGLHAQKRICGLASGHHCSAGTHPHAREPRKPLGRDGGCKGITSSATIRGSKQLARSGERSVIAAVVKHGCSNSEARCVKLRAKALEGT